VLANSELQAPDWLGG